MSNLFENEVEKAWGSEHWICNSKKRCYKLMYLKADKLGSLHYHKEKSESFKIIKGVVQIETPIYDDDYHDIIELRRKFYYQDEEIDIPIGLVHRFCAVSKDSIILETSSYHDDNDTYRLEESKDLKLNEVEEMYVALIDDLRIRKGER